MPNQPAHPNDWFIITVEREGPYQWAAPFRYQLPIDAIKALLPLCSPKELDWLKIQGIHEVQMELNGRLPEGESAEVGKRAVKPDEVKDQGI